MVRLLTVSTAMTDAESRWKRVYGRPWESRSLRKKRSTMRVRVGVAVVVVVFWARVGARRVKRRVRRRKGVACVILIS